MGEKSVVCPSVSEKRLEISTVEVEVFLFSFYLPWNT